MGIIFIIIGFVILFFNLKFKNKPLKNDIGGGIYTKMVNSRMWVWCILAFLLGIIKIIQDICSFFE